MRPEIPSKPKKTTDFATPTTRRTHPWTEQVAGSANGLQTPHTGRRTPNNAPSNKASISHSTPSRSTKRVKRHNEPGAPCPSPFTTPTLSQHANISDVSFICGVLSLLRENNINPNIKAEFDLRSLLSKYAKTAEGYRHGRDVFRTTFKAKDANITEFTYRIKTLEAEVAAEKAVSRHLRWQA